MLRRHAFQGTHRFLGLTWATLWEGGREVCSRPWENIPRTRSPGFTYTLLDRKHTAKTFVTNAYSGFSRSPQRPRAPDICSTHSSQAFPNGRSGPEAPGTSVGVESPGTIDPQTQERRRPHSLSPPPSTRAVEDIKSTPALTSKLASVHGESARRGTGQCGGMWPGGPWGSSPHESWFGNYIQTLVQPPPATWSREGY